MTVMPKPVVNLEGADGNAFTILGLWKQAALEADWTPEQIKAVMDEAVSGGYNHLLLTILANSATE